MSPFTPQVLIDSNARPLIVFKKGRTKYHAVAADVRISIVALDSLRPYRALDHQGAPYPPRKAASYWLNHSTREITKRARQVLQGLVARKPKGEPQ